MKNLNTRLKKEIIEYMLNDFQFLQDYEIIDNSKSNKNTFIAQIKNSTQKVRFIKKKFSEEYFGRFKALYKLYKSGIVLVDNMFMIEECDQIYFYIIQAELQIANTRFTNLQQFIYQNQLTLEERKSIVTKIKILVDCLHQEGQAYAGLDPRSIIVDEDRHLYLAPFELESHLKTNNYTAAYYPPQILQAISQGKLQIDQSNILKWDYWSFGCIAAQVLLFASPIFLQTSITKQLRKIKQFQLTQEICSFEEPVKNVILNSLQRDPSKRSMQTVSTTQIQSNDNEQDLCKTVKHITKTNPKSGDEFTQLNLYLDKQCGDSQLCLSLLSLQGMQFKDQLHVVVCLNKKKYHFYLDQEPHTNKYKLNKKITIKDNFTSIFKMLTQPIKIQLKSKAQIIPILVNLQTLVLVHDKRRIWNKKLLGTYKPNKTSNYSQAKIKISCILNSPSIHVQPLQDKQPQQVEIKVEAVQSKALAEVTNTVHAKKTAHSKAPCIIPSISQISNSITTLTQQFIQKISSCKEEDRDKPSKAIQTQS